MASLFRVHTRGPLLFQRPHVSSVQYVPKLRRGQRSPRAPRLPAPTTQRRRRRFRRALPDRPVIELNGHAVRGIDRAEIGPGNPKAAGIVHPASGRLADFVYQDIGSAGPRLRHPERLGTQPGSPVCACSLVSSLLLSGATMSQQSSLTQSAHSVRQVLTAYSSRCGPLRSATCGTSPPMSWCQPLCFRPPCPYARRTSVR